MEACIQQCHSFEQFEAQYLEQFLRQGDRVGHYLQKLLWKYDKDQATVSESAHLNCAYVGDIVRVAVDFPELYAWHAEEYRKQTGKELTMHVSCEIPELNFRIHTRCFACRMDADGKLRSLEDGDGKLFIQYFPVK